MYSSCTSSTIAFRTNKSGPFSFNDYYLLNERLISKIASSSCSPCSCCAFCFHGGVPMNPRVLYGLRQSTLLNFSATGRLIFGAEGRYYRLFVSDFDRNCYGDANFGRESFSGRRRRKGRGKGRRDAEFGFRNWEERSFELSVDGTAETMLGLLTEQVDEKLLLGVRKPSRRFTSVNAHLGDRQTDITNKCCKDEEKNLELDSMETHSDVRVESRGREVSSRHEHGKLRKEGSSCSSYYSVLSSDEIDDSDMDTQVKSIEFIGGSSSRHKNNEMMSAEVVVADNVREDFEKYKGHDAELGETLAYKNAGAEVSADNAVDRDVQNCKEKMFIDMSVGKKESRMESSQRDSSMMESLDTIAGKASASQKRFHARERSSVSSSNLVEKIEEKESQSIRKGIQQSAPMRKSCQFTDTTLIQGSNSRTSSSSQIQMSGRKENVSATQKVVQEARAKHDHRDQYIIRENKASLKSQSETKKLAHGVNLENISHSQTISKSGLNDTVENSAFSQTSVHDSREQHTITDQQFIGKTETREELQHLTNISASCSIDTKKLIESKDFYEMRLDTQKEKSISTMDLTQEAQGRSSEQVVRKVGLDNSKRPSELSSSWESSKEECSSSQKPARQQQLAAQTEGGRNSQAVVLPPPSQFVVKPSQETIGYQKTGRRLAQENVSLEFSGSESIGIQTEDERLGFLHKHDGQIRRDKIYGDHLHNDALDSANRLEESSKQFIGEFAEKLQHVVRTSEVEEEKTSSGKVSPYRNGKYTQEGLNQKISEDFQLQLQFPGESSAVSGTKGPSDEMWDVADPILQERSEEHAEVNPGTEIAIMKRSSRSLWSLVGDIVRMRWHTRSETNSMAMKSAERTSSNESVASDTWFSSHEVDDKIDDNVKKGKRRVQKDDRPKCQSHPGEVSSQSRGKVTNESDMSSSLGTAETGSPFEAGASLASQEGNFGDKQEIMNREGLHSTILTADSSLPVHSRRMMRSPPVRDEISESSKVVVSGGFTEAVEQPIPYRLIDTSASEPKDGELKRRKLQRSKQVLTERFEEWEEAYRLESEQRKMDEMFMREALLEARKAADTWEVPVGAVLVQHGKIIARGCNMVEELRDSTAHAEMICIREASNLLRSWRLPDTTLYVTLEPCAMCAGAILQARIDTVVWGAPNKLLGADGSWVRLFPGGLEGNTSDHTDQPAGPVHPFHPKMAIRRGVLATECSEAMQQFFQLRRKKKKADSPPPSCLPVSAHPSKLFTKIHDIFSIMFCL